MEKTATLSAMYRVVLTELGDLPMIKEDYQTRPIQPETVIMEWRPGKPRATVVVRGRYRLKDGSAGKDVRSVNFWSFRDRPEWVQALIDEHTPDWSTLLVDP